MSKKEKKSHFGKRLWDSITEPLPDDNDEQNNEQIPLAYDLKDSADSAADKPASSASSATDSADKVTSSAPAAASKSAASQAPTRKAKTSRKKSAPAQSATPASQANASAAPATEKSAAPVKATKATEKSAVSVKTAKATETTKVSKPAKRTEKQAAQSAANTKAGRTPASHHDTNTVDLTRLTSAAPTISVHGTESDDDDDQPELPLSREELYGDQQPNGGREPEKRSADNMSRVARHSERLAEDEDLEEENPHLKKKSSGERPHRKPTRHYSWKLMGVGVAILLIAGVGAFLMWNRAKSTQAEAKSNAESIVRAIYTSTAQRDLRSNASTGQLKQLQKNIDDMKDSSEKDALQKQHDYASRMMLVRTSYRNLRNEAGLINVDVTTKSIASDQQKIDSTGLTTSKPYFAKKYDKQFTSTAKIVKKVAKYDAAFKKLYTKKGKLKASTPSSDINVIQASLKTYRKKSQLAANDYRQLKADRKKLAKQAASSSSSSSSAISSSYSEPESSSSSSSEVSSYSESSSTISSSSTTTYYGGTGTDSTGTGTTGNDTQTSSAESSSTTHNSSHSTGTGTDSTGTGTGTTTNQTDGGTTNDDTTTTGNN